MSNALGGAIYTLTDSYVEIHNSSFNSCLPEYYGYGGTITNLGTMIINSSSFTNCSCDLYGAAIYNENSGKLTVNNSIFLDNKANSDRHIKSVSGGAALTDSILDTSVTFKVTNISFSSDEFLEISIDDGVSFNKINVDLLLNNKKIANINNSKFIYSLKNLSVGSYIVSLNPIDSVNGNNYIYNTNNISFYVTSPYIRVPDVEMYYKNGTRLIAYLNESNNKNITFQVNGANYTRLSANNTASLAVNLNSGYYEIVTFYENITVLSTITVKSTVDACDVVKVY